jgi:hypothetical protein
MRSLCEDLGVMDNPVMRSLCEDLGGCGGRVQEHQLVYHRFLPVLLTLTCLCYLTSQKAVISTGVPDARDRGINTDSILFFGCIISP